MGTNDAQRNRLTPGSGRVAGAAVARSGVVARIGLVTLVALLLVACGSATGVGAHTTPRPTAIQGKQAGATATPSAGTQNLADLAPAALIIPKIGLNAPIVGLGPAPDGSMQAPQTGGPSDLIWSEVYWWNVGAEPGQVGNAVIAGHVNRPDGSPSTFTYLDKLNTGDTVQVRTVGGQVLTFIVTGKGTPSVYGRGASDPSFDQVFGPATQPQLNLLTCWGQWDGTQYNERLVVYTTLVGSSPFTSGADQ